MRYHIITFLLMLCGVLLGLVSTSAHATIIHVGLTDASGSTSWTSPTIGDPHGTVTLSGWEYDNGNWASAAMYYKNSGGAETGMGLYCNSFGLNLAHNRCSQHEIGSTPWQMLDLNISKLTDWSSLTFYLGSINGTSYGDGGGANGDETGYLLGAQCTVGGKCAAPIVLGSCTDFGSNGSQTCSFTFSADYLLRLGITDIWVTPSRTNPDGTSNANILFGSSFDLQVPEPAELGIFGFGILLIGLFLGLRRRKAA